MKAVATALVLIAGAAVVLWYGNTLNSWVVGGLIGGLAALLLSIPISLVLFSFFSRHRNDQYQERGAVIVQEEVALAQHASYSVPRVRNEREFYDMDEYMDEDEDYAEDYADEFENAYDAEYEIEPVEEPYPRSRRTAWEDEQAYRVPPARYLPAPSQSRSSEPVRRKSSQQLPSTQSRRVPQQRSTARQTVPRTSYGYQADPSRSRYRSEALRAARQEAAQQAAFDEMYDISPPVQRRYGARANRTYDERDQFNDARSFSPSTSTQRYPRRPRRVIDALPPARSHHAYPPGEDEANSADFYYAERPSMRRSSRYLRQRFDDGTMEE